MLSLQPRYVPPSSPRVEEDGGQGEGEGRQACSAAPALKPVSPVSIVARRHLRCPPTFPEPFWRCPMVEPHHKPMFVMRRFVARHFSRRPC
jgi:hypothetical protein